MLDPADCLSFSPGKVLVVDDDPSIRRWMRAALADVCSVRESDCGEEALRVSAAWNPDVVLLDIMMPQLDGFAVCRQLKRQENVPQVVMVSSKSDRDALAAAFSVGADEYLTKPVERIEFVRRVQLHLRLRASQRLAQELQSDIAGRHADLKQAAKQREREIVAVQDVTVMTLAKVAESRDHATGDHVLRLREYANVVAEQLAARSPYADLIDSVFIEDLYRSSPLHDIGKVGIPDSILLKPGRLTEDEFETMKRHTIIGANILYSAVSEFRGGNFLAMGSVIARSHHERWNGAGYPAGLIGDEIPLPARIVTVADVFDALTSERPYKHAWGPDQALEEIRREAGEQFDPVVVEAFEASFDRIRVLHRRHADLAPTTVGAASFLEFEFAGAV